MLLDAAGRAAKYTALSHAWGQDLSAKTTTANLANHKKNIPFGWLPQTFRDAIKVTRQLGLNFIWIDALCIIQDDVEDKAREIPQMGYVYSKAHVTLSASHSSSSHSGLFALPVQQRPIYDPSLDNLISSPSSTDNDSP